MLLNPDHGTKICQPTLLQMSHTQTKHLHGEPMHLSYKLREKITFSGIEEVARTQKSSQITHFFHDFEIIQ